MVLLADLAAQKVGDPLPRHEILIDGPVQRLSVLTIRPILSHAGGKDRVLDVDEKNSVFLQCPMYFFKNGVQILNIV